MYDFHCGETNMECVLRIYGLRLEHFGLHVQKWEACPKEKNICGFVGWIEFSEFRLINLL